MALTLRHAGRPADPHADHILIALGAGQSDKIDPTLPNSL